MILNIFVHCALLFTLAQSENSTLASSTHNGNISAIFMGSELDSHNNTKLPLVSEGGNILPNGPDISLPQQQQQQKLTSLLSLDEELSKTKEKAVVPRKGVDNFIPDLIADGKTEGESNKTVVLSSERLNTTMSSSTVPLKSIETHVSLQNKTETKLNETKVHKKPTILSYEALANMEKNIQSSQPKIPVIPSVKTAANSQIPSPNEAPIVKVYPSKASNHPEMIMPIVITILVVPMFAIVGYMALKRGQEAWKNRHYKRMDFLLDGMYND